MSDIINIDGFQVGGDSTYLIAEIGSNHNQSMDLAKESIHAAKESGAHAVKFQSLRLDKLYLNPSQDIRDIHARIDLEESWHKELQDYSKSLDITFFSSPTYLDSVQLLQDLNVPVFKLASAQIGTFPQIIKVVAATQKPVILSTGIVTLSQLEEVTKIFEKENNPNYIILHCNSMYPTPYDKINLGRIGFFREKFGKIIGFSDHSDGINTAIAAVALGAKVIEKHFAIDRNLPVPDAPFSLEPDEFAKMAEGIRQTEQAILTDEREFLEDAEAEFKAKILYRLVAKRAIAPGEKLDTSMIMYLRNEQGIDCRAEASFLGKTVKNRIEPETLIKEEDLV